jgi:hypothetical protein
MRFVALCVKALAPGRTVRQYALMKDAEVIEALGGTAKVARDLGVRAQLVSGWKKRGISAEQRPAVLALARSVRLSVDEDEFLRVPTHLRCASAEAA